MDCNVHALFLGPKSENRAFFKQMLDFVMDEHIHWRRDFHPSDKPVASLKEQRSENYAEALMRTEEALLELSARLKSGSVPFFSPRYLGHMISDTLMAANLGYLATILYNPNNCSYEASSASTLLELEVGQQLCGLFGYDPETSWGHITSGGTVANYEAMWVARNLRSLAGALSEVRPDLMEGFNQVQRANLPVDTLLGLLARSKEQGDLDAVRQATAQFRGASQALGKVLVPQSKHYSWTKALDILGLGQDAMLPIPVDSKFRMDTDYLRQTLTELLENGTPIMAVVTVAGSTESGAVDQIHHVTALRRELRERLGVGFYLHVDGAYGGYVRSMFRDADGQLMKLHDVHRYCARQSYFSPQVQWPDEEIYEAFAAISETDSVTVDPHKLGYVPYAAGGIVMKDRRALDLISYFAAYTFEGEGVEPALLGSFIMEGSRPGASAASVWMAHKVLPLSIEGYGKLLAHSVDGAQLLYQSMLEDGDIEVEGSRFKVTCLTQPDLNVVNFVFNQVGNKDLNNTNELNRFLYDQCSYRSGPVYLEDFILSKTIIKPNIYQAALEEVLHKIDIPKSELARVGQLFVLRSCMMTPYLTSNQTFREYRSKFYTSLRRHLERYVITTSRRTI